MMCIAVKTGMKQNDIKIAVTGGIGSGKSTVCQIIRQMGYSVLSCDAVYADIVRDKAFIQKLANEFGDEILLSDGGLNRKKLSEIVFCDKAKLKRLDEITHPAIFEEMYRRAEGKGLTFFEVPLLFEGGYQKLFDCVVVVVRNKEKRIAEVMHRDGLSIDEVCRRIDNQFDYDNAQLGAYYVLNNDNDMPHLKQEVENLISKITLKK